MNTNTEKLLEQVCTSFLIWEKEVLELYYSCSSLGFPHTREASVLRQEDSSQGGE